MKASSAADALAPKAAKKQKQAPATRTGAWHKGRTSLRATVNVAGWSVSGADVPSSQLHAVSHAIAATLGDGDQVRLRAQVLHARTASTADVGTAIDSADAPATVVDFEIVTEAPGSRELLDNAESRLLLLAMSGNALRSFDEVLTAGLLAENAAVQGVTRSSFSEPWQLFAAQDP